MDELITHAFNQTQTQGYHWTEAALTGTNDLTHSETMNLAAVYNIKWIFTFL